MSDSSIAKTQIPSTSSDIEAQVKATPDVFDIEHMPVADDPRQWSSLRKNFTLALVAAAAMVAALASNIQNPAAPEIQAALHASDTEYSLSISLFALLQGVIPILWSTISEVRGRKVVYIISLTLFTAGSIAVALSRSISLLVGFRCMQAIGSSAVITIGAATLADMFEPAERGLKMGIYYIAPQLGPAMGPVFGGILTSTFNWRANFWFLAILGGFSTSLFLLTFKDTFRTERSLTYQNIIKTRLQQMTSSNTPAEKPSVSRTSTMTLKAEVIHVEIADLPQVKVSLTDANPFKAQIQVLRNWNNITILFASGIQYAFSFMLSYTTSRTLADSYHYDALATGIVLLSYGLGCILGSLTGGWWSDHELCRLRQANGGKWSPEMRLRSTILGVALLPPCILGLGWACEERAHIAVIVLLLFACGFSCVWQYASALAYLVDANVGRSSSVVASNSAFRGLAAFAATEAAVPIQNALGNGWLDTIWAILLIFSGFLIFLTFYKGKAWREAAQAAQDKPDNSSTPSIPTSKQSEAST
ncbi:MFS general substrate transporter [Pluteus cervinus]|uniref:MFS general substrate transporter n=1 Tax=Pluteus cervinus TaxID=181527 RepID=A0ACD3AUU5_9AGAR|nr:MFS general substrate transporter [Pluteus cervinus]